MIRLFCYYHRLLRRTLHRSVILFSMMLVSLVISTSLHAQKAGHTPTFDAGDKRIQYTGRIDFTNPRLPRFWQPGVTISVRVEGFRCKLIVQDEMLWGKNHNYIELVVDGKAIRMQTKTKRDTINAGEYFIAGKKFHDVQLVKNTEANIGYMEFAGVLCSNLVMPPPKPVRKFEFIGNSITCGTGSDLSEIPCGKGVWQDQHNAYLSYGPTTARALNAQYYLSAVSGIGLMHSCCNMNVIMPQVFDKISMRNDTITWNFKDYQPDVVTICLGQNDGVQDSSIFCGNYLSFARRLRNYYPNAMIICLSSPMADATLAAFMKKTLTAVVKEMNKQGDKNIHSYFFSKQYHNGCDGHPDLAEHRLIAAELTSFIKKTMKW
jgi:hypothetical protein